MTGEQEAITITRLVLRLEQLQIPYMVAGSVASSHHGRPRATNGADVLIDPTPEALEELAAGLLSFAQQTIRYCTFRRGARPA